jgi:membrane fusion protein, multidrug efflux system
MSNNNNETQPNIGHIFAAIIIMVIIVVVTLTLIGYGIFKKLMMGKMMAKYMTPQTPIVEVAAPEVNDVPLYYEFVGRTQAVEEVMIPARVSGFLEEIYFEEGSYVEKGQKLFKIEDTAYIAARDQAKAQLDSAQAELTSAESDLERIRQARNSGAVSEQQLTTAQAMKDKANASVLAAKAALSDAELNLSYTDVNAPISGRISRNFVDKGNLVGPAQQTMLANIVKLEPIEVTFTISEDFLHGQLDIDEIIKGKNRQFSLSLEENDNFPFTGRLNYIDNQVDEATGTILIRGQLANEEHKILPGMYSRKKIAIGEKENAILVPEKAVLSDLGGKYVLVLDKDNTLRRRQVKSSIVIDKMRIIESGLSPDEKFVLTGLNQMGVQAGVKVQTQQQTDDPNNPKQGNSN